MRTEEKKNGPGKTHPFVTDVKEIRRRARTHIEEGAVTEVYRAHRETVVRLLNEALASAIVCVLRYRRHYFMATGIHAHAVAQEFLQHANDEQGNEDPTSRRLIEEILAKEEEHAEDLKALIETLGRDERAVVVILDPCGESFLDAYGAR